MASVTVDVDIDEFDDDEIVIAAKERGYRVLLSKEQLDKFDKWARQQIEKHEIETYEETSAEDDLSEILTCIRRGQIADAVSIIEALLFPKFKTLTECEEKYSAIKKQVAAS